MPRHGAKRILRIPAQIVEPHGPVEFVEPLLRLSDIAERSTRGRKCVIRIHALSDEPVPFDVDVRENLFGKIFVRSLARHLYASSDPRTREIAAVSRRHCRVSSVSCFRPVFVSW